MWEYTTYWNLYRDDKSIFSKSTQWYHAYSHVNTLNGAAQAYRVTGERGYLDTVIHAYDFLQAHQLYATGGFGPNESLLPPEQLQKALDEDENHFEVQCGSWAGFKLSKSLISFTGQSRYGDWIEKLMINAIGASIPMNAKGWVTYYADYSLSGSAKTYTVDAWPCCAGTRIQAVADYNDLIFFKDADSIYVNLYTPASVAWKHGDVPITLRQRTRFPEQETVEISVSLQKEDHFALKLRAPAWLAAPMEVLVNGKSTDAPTAAGGWRAIDRTWRDGDVVQLRLPMGFHADRFPPDSASAFPCAISYGPVVLAMRAPDGNPSCEIDFAHLDRAFTPAAGEPLTFHLAAHPSVLARPFYAFRQDQPYFIYLDPAHAWTRVAREHLKFTGDWQSINGLSITNHPDASVEFEFDGAGLRWFGKKFDDAGIGELLIDGKSVAKMDLYDPNRDVPTKQQILSLSPGHHTAKWILLADKNPKSHDRFLNLIRFETLATARPAS